MTFSIKIVFFIIFTFHTSLCFFIIFRFYRTSIKTKMEIPLSKIFFRGRISTFRTLIIIFAGFTRFVAFFALTIRIVMTIRAYLRTLQKILIMGKTDPILLTLITIFQILGTFFTPINQTRRFLLTNFQFFIQLISLFTNLALFPILTFLTIFTTLFTYFFIIRIIPIRTFRITIAILIERFLIIIIRTFHTIFVFTGHTFLIFVQFVSLRTGL